MGMDVSFNVFRIEPDPRNKRIVVVIAGFIRKELDAEAVRDWLENRGVQSVVVDLERALEAVGLPVRKQRRR